MVVKENSCEILLPDAFLTVPANAFMGVLTGDSVPLEDQPAARDFGRSVIVFQRSNDVGGNALNLSPWLRFIAPDKTGYRPSFSASEKMNAFMTVSQLVHIVSRKILRAFSAEGTKE